MECDDFDLYWVDLSGKTAFLNLNSDNINNAWIRFRLNRVNLTYFDNLRKTTEVEGFIDEYSEQALDRNNSAIRGFSKRKLL